VRLNIQSPVISDAEGLLRLHEGKIDEAAALFQQARMRARNEGNRLDEFQALEHLFMLELQRERYDAASVLSSELVSISNKLRDGSDAAFARALAALSLYAEGKAGAAALLQEEVDHVRASGAKYRLAYVLTRAAELDLRSGNSVHARMHAQEALEIAQILDRPSEIALAYALLAQAAEALKDQEALKQHTEELHKLSLAGASHYVQQAVQRLVGDPGMYGQQNHARQSFSRLAEA
jgi:tetratricopeptide (TPR) repeat protein